MNVVPNDIGKKRRKSDSKLPHIQLNKCLNEKRRREQENIYIEELAELISASLSDMSSLSVKPDKCAILQETVKQIRLIKQQDCESSDDLQASEVSSSRPTILANDVLGPLLLEALDGFLFIVNNEGIIEFVSENVTSFLKYAQSELVGKSIYTIIHSSDQPRFSSNLLPMSAIGNGFSWSEITQAASTSSSTTSQSKSRSFNSRFMVKAREDEDNSSDCDDSDSEFRSLMKSATSSKTRDKSSTQYENMQISAVLVPPLESKRNSSTPNSTTTEESSLVCVARRIPATEKSSTNVVVEQFTTRLDLTGKVLAIDTSGVSSTYSQYLNKDLVGKIFLELCHPNDFPRVQQHLKETLSIGSNANSGIYRLMMANDKYVHVQTKSKRFSGNQVSSEPSDFIMATHSIIRDSETSGSSEPSSSRGGTPSPITTTTWSGNPTFASTIAHSSNGQMGGANSSGGNLISINSNLLTGRQTPCSSISTSSSVTGQVIYANTQTGMITTTPFLSSFSALSPSNVEFSLNDCLGLSEMFPSSSVSWDNYDNNSQEAATSNAPVMTQTVTSLANTSTSSPIYTPVTTPPSMTLTVSGQTTLSPMAVSSPSMANLVRSPSTSSPQSVTANYNHNSAYDKYDDYSPSGISATHKLRNLLTHGMTSSAEEADSPVIKKEPGIANDNILRELLDQDDDGDQLASLADTPVASAPVNTPATPSYDSSGPASVASDSKKVANNNNMLRMLLNDDDIGKKTSDIQSRKNQDLLEQLLKDNDNRDNNNSFLIHFKREHNEASACSTSSSSLATNINDVMVTSMNANKRKSIDDTSSHYEQQLPDSKRAANASISGISHPSAHLAGQNPMLAKMLARTPTSLPEDITIPTSIISQTPQDKLPRNLKEKLIPTPVHHVSGIQLVPQQSGHVSTSGGFAIVTSVAASSNQNSMLTSIVTNNNSNISNISQLRPQLQQIHNLQHLQASQQPRLQIQAHPQQQVQQVIKIHSQQQQEIHIQQMPGQQIVQQSHQQVQQLSQQQPNQFLQRIITDSGQSSLNRTQILSALQSSTASSQQIQVMPPFYQTQQTHQQQQQQQQQHHLQQQQQQQQQPMQTNSIPVSVASAASQASVVSLDDHSSNSDQMLSLILDDFINMQQEMNLDLPRNTQKSVSHVLSVNEDTTTLLKLLEEVIEPAAPNVTAPTATTPVVDLNERMAISAIQKQLMSFEVTTPTSPNVVVTPFTTVTNAPPNYQQIPPPAYSATTYGQQITNSVQQTPSQANFQLQPRPQPRLKQPRQPYMPQNMQLNPALTQVANQVRSANLQPSMRKVLENKKGYMLLEQQKRLLAQQSQQQMIPQTQQPSHSDTVGFGAFPENMSDLLNNTVAPNVALTVKPRSVGPPTPDGAQLSPRYPVTMNSVASVSSPLPQSPAPQQLSPGPRPPYSPAPAQQSYPSPSGASYPTANQHRMSPHFVSSPSPAQGPHSPLMQMSPQTNNWSQPVRPTTMTAVNTSSQSVMQQSSQNVSIQQTNPMLNAQLSGNGPTYVNNGQRFQHQQRPMRATAPQPRNARSSPFPEQYGSAPPQFNATAVTRPQRVPVTTLPSPMRVNSPRFTNDSSLPSPSYQSVTTFSQSDQFSFEQAFTQQSSANASQSPHDRTRNNSGMTSEYVKQELRAMVSGRTQQQQMQQQSPQQLQPQQQMSSQLSSQTLTQADLEMFGLSLGLSDSGDDFTQGLLNISAADVSSVANVSSPASHLNMSRNSSMDDSKPSDQKKSLLQQLLSEPS